MYTFSKRLKIISILLFVVGAIGWGTSYLSSHGLTIEDVKILLAEENSHHGGEVSHGADTTETSHHEVKTDNEAHVAMIHSTHDSEVHTEDIRESDDHGTDAHAEHVLHQMHNRPYAALYVAAFFFFMISLGVLAFYAIQYAAQAGWSPVLFRVMEAITYYLLPGDESI